jgi:hypothetical protein
MMADFNSHLKTDLVDDHVAEDVNKLIQVSMRSEYNNTETITATRELADIDFTYQVITASGADRTVELPPEATTNHPFLIHNAGATYNLVVKDDSGTTTYLTLIPGQASLFMQLQPALYNYLINGGFDFAQRQAPGTLTAITDNRYAADRWRVTRENADVQYIRVDATGESGLTSKYYGQLKKITNAGKLHICQIIEGVNTVPLRSKTVIFQVKMKASSSKTIRMAILELQNAGTMDSIPATLVTAFGVDSTDPTLGTNVAVITAAQSKSVTTSWQSCSVAVTVPSNSKNLICAIWSDADFSANDTLSIAEAGLFYGSVVQAWTPRLTRDELSLCQRYYWKSFSLDTAPAQNTGVVGAVRFPAGKAGANSEYASFSYPVPMRAAPTLTFFNPSAANAQTRDSVAGADCSATVAGGNANENIFSVFCTGNASTAVGNALDVHATAEADL